MCTIKVCLNKVFIPHFVHSMSKASFWTLKSFQHAKWTHNVLSFSSLTKHRITSSEFTSEAVALCWWLTAFYLHFILLKWVWKSLLYEWIESKYQQLGTRLLFKIIKFCFIFNSPFVAQQHFIKAYKWFLGSEEKIYKPCVESLSFS